MTSRYALEYRISILKLKTRLEESHAISECGQEINERTVQIVSYSMERSYGKYACTTCQLLLKSMRQSKKRAKFRVSLPKKTPHKTPIACTTPKTKWEIPSRKRAQLFKLKKKMVNSQEKKYV